MKKFSILFLLCTFMCSLTSWAQQTVTRKLVINLSNGKVVEYKTDDIQKISVQTTGQQESNLIKVEEIGKDYFTFTIRTNGQRTIFTACESGYLDFYGDEFLAYYGHIIYEDGTYEWRDGTSMDIQEIEVKPGHKYTIMAAQYEEYAKPDFVEKVEITTIADEQSSSSVDIKLEEITANSVKVIALPSSEIDTYITYIREKSWTDETLTKYGEALLQSTTERAAELGLARTYTVASDDSWTGLSSNTEYTCIVVYTDIEGKKNMKIYNFKTL